MLNQSARPPKNKVTELLTDLQAQLPDSAEKNMVQEVLAQVGENENAAATEPSTPNLVTTATEVVTAVTDLADGKAEPNQSNGLVASIVEAAATVITTATDNKP